MVLLCNNPLWSCVCTCVAFIHHAVLTFLQSRKAWIVPLFPLSLCFSYQHICLFHVSTYIFSGIVLQSRDIVSGFCFVIPSLQVFGLAVTIFRGCFSSFVFNNRPYWKQRFIALDAHHCYYNCIFS